ncbi:MAG: hypothetical protein MUC41_19260 [Syntrophobacteraceae bacterium]|nr:hypothetical protein [Syntrophobacteraceae bacterium]
MIPSHPNLISSNDRALAVVLRLDEISVLYRKALRTMDEGSLRSLILNAAVEALDDPSVLEEVLVSGDHMFSFMCGIWIQFLLTEVAGMKKESLRELFKGMMWDMQEDRCLH